MLPTCELHEQYAFVFRRVCVERAGLLKACMCGQDAADSAAADLVIVGSGQLSSVQMSQGAKCDGLGLYALKCPIIYHTNHARCSTTKSFSSFSAPHSFSLMW